MLLFGVVLSGVMVQVASSLHAFETLDALGHERRNLRGQHAGPREGRPDSRLALFRKQRHQHVHGVKSPFAKHFKLNVDFEENRTVIHDGMERTYSVVLPEGHQQKPPVLLMFHGSGSDAAAFAAEGFMATEAPRKGYLTAYLDAPWRSGDSNRVWSSGSASSLLAAEEADDVGFSSTVVADLIQNYDIDEKRVYAVGISGGASMAIRVACERPEMIAAVASVHGSLESRRGGECAKNCKPHGSCEWDTENPSCGPETWEQNLEPVYSCDGIQKNKVGVLLFHGNRDWFTSRYGEVWVSNATMSKEHVHFVEAAKKLAPYNYPPRAYMYNSFARTLGCGQDEEVTFENGTGGDRTKCASYAGCSANFTACVSKAGHWWYGNPYDIVPPCLYKGSPASTCTPEQQFWDYGRTTASIETTAEILNFCGKHSKVL